MGDTEDQVFETTKWTRLKHEAPNNILGPREFAFKREVFSRLFSSRTEKLNPVRPEFRNMERLHEELGSVPEFEALRQRCDGNAMRANLVASDFADSLLEKLPPAPAAHNVEKARRQVRALKRMSQCASSPEEAKAMLDAAEGTAKAGKAAMDALAKATAAMDPAAVRNASREAAAKALAQLAETESRLWALAGWDNSPANPSQINPAHIQTALTMLRDPEMRKLADLAGRMRRLAIACQRSKCDGASEITSITRGSDLGRLLPSELAKMKTQPGAFKLGFMEGSLLQFELEHEEPLGRGPIVICVDESSSMSGTPNLWAKAVCIGLMQVAQRQKRDVWLIPFSDGVSKVGSVPANAEAIRRIAREFRGGGTNFEHPLGQAGAVISTEAKAKQADVIFITDGFADVSDVTLSLWARRKRENGIRCYGVSIGSDVVPEIMHKFCDKVIPVADLANETASTELFSI